MDSSINKHSGEPTMKRNSLLAIALAGTCAALVITDAQAQETVTYAFTQTGFDDGGTISGIIRGRDLDGDGVLYSLSPFGAGSLGLPPGNEVDYVEVTFDGFNRELPVTLVYDKAVADITDFDNLIMGFVYYLNGGPIGDEPNEGISFAPFGGLTYTMGQLFDSYIPDVTLTTCGIGSVCATVLEYGDAPQPIYDDVSSAAIETGEVEDMAGRTYQVVVRDFLGNTFPDCLRFDDFGTLTIDGMGQILTWRQKRLDLAPNAWQATSRAAAALPIAFDGVVSGTTINGDAIDEDGDTYIIRGQENPACTLAPQFDATAWQR